MTRANVTDSEAAVTRSAHSPRHHGLLLVGELGALIALTIADARGLIPLSRTPFLLLLCWASLRLRQLSWRDIGFIRPPRMRRAIAIGLVTGVAIEVFAISVTTPWIASVTGTPPDVSDFRGVVGNWQLLLIVLPVIGILAAFGEEVAFRGYLMNRVADGFGCTRVGWIVSLVLVSVYFGIGHGTQGVAGIAQESLSGCWLGVSFLASGRNLTVPIVAHGVSNSLAFVLIYLNHYPGLS
jgi:membrane protease YdiL (CAAX protease family)